MLPVEIDITLKICIPIFTLILGIIINRIVEAKPKLITYYSHVSAIQIPIDGSKQLQIHSHTIIITNIGRNI